jgi:hypothetical protein
MGKGYHNKGDKAEKVRREDEPEKGRAFFQRI